MTIASDLDRAANGCRYCDWIESNGQLVAYCGVCNRAIQRLAAFVQSFVPPREVAEAAKRLKEIDDGADSADVYPYCERSSCQLDKYRLDEYRLDCVRADRLTVANWACPHIAKLAGEV